MPKFFFSSLIVCFIFVPLSCTTDADKESGKIIPPEVDAMEAGNKIAGTIIRSAIKSAGLDRFEDAKASFNFRGKQYTCQNKQGAYKYERKFTSEKGEDIIDILTNEGFTRLTNGDTTALEDKKARAYSNSVNSVIYFAFLPFRLNDPAVKAKYLAKVDINGKSYHKIQVSFLEKGGGDDFDDVFIYWFDTKTYRMDYLAYEYHTDGGGMRFREAFNARNVVGATIQDFKNYKPKEKGSIPLDKIDLAFQNDQLELLSEIILENMAIEWF